MARALFSLKTSIARLVKSKLAKSTSIYFLSYAVSLGVPFFLLPVMTAYIDPEGYGHLAMLQMLLSIATTFIIFALRNPIIQAVSVGNAAESGRFVSACLCVMGLMFFLLLVGIMVAHTELSELTSLSLRWMIVIVVAAFGLVLNQVNMAVLQSTHRAGTFALTQISFSTLSAVTSVFMVVSLHTGWSGRGVAITVVAMFSGVCAILRFAEAGTFHKPKWSELSDALTFGASGIPYSLSVILSSYVDRIFLSLYFTFYEVGVYAVATHVAQGYAACGEALNLALAPWIYKQLKAIEHTGEIRRLSRLALIVAGAVTAGAILYYLTVGEIAFLLISKQYTDSSKYFFWLLGGVTAHIIFIIFSAVLYHYRKRAILSAIGVFDLVSTPVLIYVFASAYGTLGTAIGLFINRLLLLIMLLIAVVFLMARHHYQLVSKTDGKGGLRL